MSTRGIGNGTRRGPAAPVMSRRGSMPAPQRQPPGTEAAAMQLDHPQAGARPTVGPVPPPATHICINSPPAGRAAMAEGSTTIARARCRSSGRRRRGGMGADIQAGSSSSAGISRPRRSRRRRRYPGSRPCGTPLAARVAGQRQIRGDADIRESHRLKRGQHLGILDMDDGGPLQGWRRWMYRSVSVPALRWRLTAGAADMLPFGGQRLVQPVGRRLREIVQVHAVILRREARQPDVLHREGQDRRQPGHQPVEQQVQHRPRRPPAPDFQTASGEVSWMSK